MLRRFFFHFAYYSRPPWDTGITPPEVTAYIASRPPGRALDLGCGSGTNCITLAQNGWQVTGVDYAWSALRIARRRAKKAHVPVDFRMGDVSRLERLSGAFDLILDIGCFHSLPASAKDRYAQNIARWLATGGVFMLYAFFKPGEEQPGPGIVEADVNRLASRLTLLNRANGSDRGLRPSSWFTFSK